MELLGRPFIRSLEGHNLLEIFFATAVASVLGIRFFLVLTGYPQLGGRGLHIAHVLLGGLFLMLALLIALAYINKSALYVAAFLGGFGFGAFIDELGKFITGDNNYFFRPAVAMIYVTFVLLYLGIEIFFRRPELTQQERLINALEIAKEAVLEDLDHRERKQALELLRGCNPSDPVTRALRDLLYAVDSRPPGRPGPYSWAKIHARKLYRRLVQKSWFANAFIAFFLLQAFSALAVDLLLLYAKLRWRIDLNILFPTLSFVDQIGLASATIAALIVIAGVIKMRFSRLEAYRLLKNAVLVQIFLVQVFLFYHAQFLALLGLAGNLCVLLVLYYMINQENAAQSICPA
jgi:hypothetical protein